MPKQFDPIKAALGDYSDEQNKAVESVLTFGEKAGGVLEQAVSTGGDPRLLGGVFRSRLEEVLKNAGIPPEQIAEYVGLAGLGEFQIAPGGLRQVDQLVIALNAYAVDVGQRPTLGVFSVAEQGGGGGMGQG